MKINDSEMAAAEERFVNTFYKKYKSKIPHSGNSEFGKDLLSEHISDFLILILDICQVKVDLP